MRFAPEYVTNVLNDNFEDAKELLLAPLMSIHYAHLVMLDRAAHRLARRRPRAAPGARRHLARRGPGGALRRHLRRSVLLHRTPDRRGLRRGRRRPAAHRAQPQRHRHDDVPDAAARVHRAHGRGDADPAAGACSSWPPGTPETVFGAHTHTQPAQPSTIAHYLLAVIEQLERDAKRLAAAYGSTNQNPLGACAITGTGFPIDRHRTSELLGFDGPTGNTYGSIATVDYLLESVSATAIARRRPRPRRAGPAALVHDGVRLPAARRRLRAVEQHHAAEAQPGGARARARHRQQGGGPGAGDHDRRAQHAVRRHRRHRGRPAAARRVDVPRRHAHGDAGRGGDQGRRSSTSSGWRRAPARAARRSPSWPTRWCATTGCRSAPRTASPAWSSEARNDDPAASLSRPAGAGLDRACSARRSATTTPALEHVLSPRHFVEIRKTLGGPAPERTTEAIAASRAALAADDAWWKGRRDAPGRAPRPPARRGRSAMTAMQQQYVRVMVVWVVVLVGALRLPAVLHAVGRVIRPTPSPQPCMSGSTGRSSPPISSGSSGTASG